jgi:hypothetical protein
MTKQCEVTGQLQAKMWESFVREWVRRVGGDAAVATFDDQGGVPEQQVADIGNKLVAACAESGNIPGMSEGYLDEDVRDVVLGRIRAGQTDPWNDLVSDLRLDTPTGQCAPSASATEMWCCPSNTYTDPYYTGETAQKTQGSFIERAGPYLLAIGGFGFGLFLLTAGGEPKPVGR